MIFKNITSRLSPEFCRDWVAANGRQNSTGNFAV